ncbi:hypothetical protein [Methylobacterium sp. Leaf93]|uniref:hypothetical protein n=1 Tax=Methylobacterium sp. Leaf93 TaxID=1736249 RepID=UPI000701405D|nr:hypothetical protein [Methylobacterium sp. Leaf93]KQP02719.1 hypothetical protein ASF26_14925 [Methylobacterium sp. Leaf93]
MKTLARKKHGRRQKSGFRIGFDALRDGLVNTPTPPQPYGLKAAQTEYAIGESCTVVGVPLRT